MAEASEAIEKKPLVFDYYDNIKENQTTNKMYGRCKECHKEIRGQPGVTSNFVTHLKVKSIKLTSVN